MTPAERATKERQAQGLPRHVEDAGVLDRVAALLLAGGADHGGDGPVDPPPLRKRPSTTRRLARKARDADG